MKRKTAAVSLLTLLAAGIIIFAAVYCQNEFVGDRNVSSDFYSLKFDRMTGTDEHTLELAAGDALKINFEAVKGSVNMKITAPNGTELYTGNGRETADFAVKIPESGAYTVKIKARRAKGTVLISKSGG